MGATLAYINGGDPLSGGGVAVAAETAAQYLARQYDDGQTARDPVTGEFNPNLLPESVKEEIRATTGVIASIVGATGDGGAALNAQIGGVIGQNAVENNYLSLKDVNDLRAELRVAKTEEEKERIFEKYRKKGESKSQALRESCRGKGDECHLNAIAELRNTNQAAATIVNNGLLLSLTESGRTDLSAWGLALDSNLPDLSYHEGQLSGGVKLLDTGVKLSPVVVAAATAGGSKAAQAARTVKNTVKIPDSISTVSINPNTIRFSQNTVSYSKIDRATGKPFTYDDLVSSMRIKGWQGEPVDVIKMPDNKLTSMDNTRIRAARDAGIEIKANVHNFNDPLPDRMITSGRFGDAKTWGEAITKRISDQRPKSFGNNNPSGASTAPKITGKSK